MQITELRVYAKFTYQKLLSMGKAQIPRGLAISYAFNQCMHRTVMLWCSTLCKKRLSRTEVQLSRRLITYISQEPFHIHKFETFIIIPVYDIVSWSGLCKVLHVNNTNIIGGYIVTPYDITVFLAMG